MKTLLPNFIAKHFAAEHDGDLVLQPQIKFYMEAAFHGDHGEIVVTNHALKLKDKAVRFVFAGRQEPPALDLVVMKEIWKQAMEQGYLPQHIVRYGLPEVEQPATEQAQHRDPNAKLEPGDGQQAMATVEVIAGRADAVRLTAPDRTSWIDQHLNAAVPKQPETPAVIRSARSGQPM